MPLMPHPVLEEKLYTKLAFSETQGRAVRARESPNDEGKTGNVSSATSAYRRIQSVFNFAVSCH